jgi:hypothetical protein
VSLKEELENLSPRAKTGTYSKGRCGINEWLKTQTDEFILDFRDLITSPSSTMELHRFLQAKFSDLPFSLTTFRTHRNKWCSCP